MDRARQAPALNAGLRPPRPRASRQRLSRTQLGVGLRAGGTGEARRRRAGALEATGCGRRRGGAVAARRWGRVGRSPCRASDAAADQHAAEEDHDRDDGRRHEQEHELLAAQLNLVEAVVGGVV